jgi:protein-S-isoprenylcysteine O-methyltransferase Ste14
VIVPSNWAAKRGGAIHPSPDCTLLVGRGDQGYRPTHRSAHAWPSAPFERFLIAIWMVDISVWLAEPVLLIAGFSSRWTAPIIRSNVLAVAGALTGLTAMAISFVAWNEMGDSWRLGTDDHELTTLVRSGVFEIVRHPIYLAQGLLLAASLLMLPAPVYLLLAVVHVWCIHEKTAVEERYLRHAHGDAYRQYQERVGRFWPRS